MNYEFEKNNIQRAITEVMAFFDLFDFPMTAFEVWQNLKIKCEYEEIVDQLNIMVDVISEKNGFYFLKGGEGFVKTRMERFGYADRKFKRAIKIAKLFKIIPWIEMIGIGNIYGSNNLKDNSDIDFIIFTEEKRVWISRFFCVVLAKIFRLRPQPGKTRDKICLSFFADKKSFNFEKLMLKADSVSNLPDLNFVYWVAGITPIYDKNNIYELFINQNSWLENYLPNWCGHQINYQRNAGRGYSQFYRDVIDMLVGGLEKKIKRFSLKIMPLKIKDMMNKDTRVVVNDQVLKFHTNDRREETRSKYLEKIKNYELRMKNF
jgi:hypothetical protein